VYPALRKKREGWERIPRGEQMFSPAVAAWERIPRKEQMLLPAVAAWERIPRKEQMLLPAVAAWGARQLVSGGRACVRTRSWKGTGSAVT